MSEVIGSSLGPLGNKLRESEKEKAEKFVEMGARAEGYLSFLRSIGKVDEASDLSALLDKFRAKIQSALNDDVDKGSVSPVLLTFVDDYNNLIRELSEKYDKHAELENPVTSDIWHAVDRVLGDGSLKGDIVLRYLGFLGDAVENKGVVELLTKRMGSGVRVQENVKVVIDGYFERFQADLKKREGLVGEKQRALDEFDRRMPRPMSEVFDIDSEKTYSFVDWYNGFGNSRNVPGVYSFESRVQDYLRQFHLKPEDVDLEFSLEEIENGTALGKIEGLIKVQKEALDGHDSVGRVAKLLRSNAKASRKRGAIVDKMAFLQKLIVKIDEIGGSYRSLNEAVSDKKVIREGLVSELEEAKKSYQELKNAVLVESK